MKRNRLRTEQIIGILKEHETGIREASSTIDDDRLRRRR